MGLEIIALVAGSLGVVSSILSLVKSFMGTHKTKKEIEKLKSVLIELDKGGGEKLKLTLDPENEASIRQFLEALGKEKANE